jgi:tetratricopeptide (TPR) repeat protein
MALGLGLVAIAGWASPGVAAMPTTAPALLASARPIAGAEESYQRGLALIVQGEFRDAIVEFNRAVRMDPTYAEAYHDRGNAYAGLGNEVAAFADYNKAITLDPDYGNAYYNRGNLYLQREQYHQAIADYDRAIALNAEDAESHHNRALAQAMLGELAEAVTNLQQAAQLFAAAGDQDGFNRALEALRYLQPDLDPSNLPSPAAHTAPDTTASRTNRSHRSQ